MLVILCLGSAANALTVRTASAPTDDLDLTLSAIQSAKKTLYFNAYELTSAPIVAALVERINAGVAVSLLQEGQPVGNINADGQKAQSDILAAMNKKTNNHYFVMEAKTVKERRYRFDHAKYAIVDGQALLIGSENYSDGGHTPPGKSGNRGWEVLLNDDPIVKEFINTFRSDVDTSHGDIKELTGDRAPTALGLAAISALEPLFNHGWTSEADSFADSLASFPDLAAREVHSIMSPTTSLSGLTGMMNQARQTLDLELMTFSPNWADGVTPSPLYQSVVDTAKRNVHVRVLLNDERSFNPGLPLAKSKNWKTVNSLNELAKSQNLNLEARIANIKAMGVNYIHNKGALIDDDKTLISSINWNSNSVTNNREAAVLITSTDVHRHYQDIFDGDWEKSQSTN
jgi:cardiolipin synthase